MVAMTEKFKLPAEYQKIVDKYYEQPCGDVPPPIANRMATGVEWAPEFNMFVEKVRCNAFISDGLDPKTTQLIVLGILAGIGTPGCNYHVKSAPKFGATWDEIFETAEIAMFIKGNTALVDTGDAIARVYQEEMAD